MISKILLVVWYLLIAFLSVSVVNHLVGCSPVQAEKNNIVLAPAPLPGYTCFVIENKQGEPVGGSCTKDQY